VRRRFYEIQAATPAPIASEALVRIVALYAVEADIRGASVDERRRVRQLRARPIIDTLRPWLEAKLAVVSGKSTIAEAIRYALSRWDAHQILGRRPHRDRLQCRGRSAARTIFSPAPMAAVSTGRFLPRSSKLAR
jgi:Transposase IS66 family